MTQYGLNSCTRPPPVSDHLGLTFWVVANGRFDCIQIEIETIVTKTVPLAAVETKFKLIHGVRVERSCL